MPGSIYLFDIDGTLLWSGGAGSAALDRAFLEVCGIAGAMAGVSCDGKTDPGIVREVLGPRGLHRADTSAAVLEAYVRHLAQTLPAHPGYRVLPGAEDCLRYLTGRGVPCGLATGNLEAGARAKLAEGGLLHYFSFGGYGSDAEDRTELVRVAIARGRVNGAGPHARPVVLGDTPRDIAAAHGAGALAVGVAAGNFDRAALSGSGADLVLDDLADPERWVPEVERLLDLKARAARS